MNILIIDREAREVRLRNAAARLAWQNHGLYRISLKVRAFYRGESSDLPKAKHRLERALDPKRNGADAIIDEFAEVLKLYLPDEIPREPLRVAYYSTLKLIECGIESVHRHNCLNHLETLLGDMKTYFTHPKFDKTIEDHRYWVDYFRKLWKHGCYKISDTFYNYTTEALERSEKSANAGVRHAASYTRAYKTRAAISFKRAAELSGLSERTIKNLEKDPKNSAYPGRNVSEHAFLAWSVGYQTEKAKRHWANMTNHPIPISSLPNFLQAKLGFKNSATFGQS